VSTKVTKRPKCGAASAAPFPKQAASPARVAAGFVLATRTPPTRFLLLRAYRNWDFPKGMVEPGEDSWTAARRELTEETGLEAGLAFPCARQYIETPPYAGGKVARFYLALTDATDVRLGINSRLGRPEHREFRWLEFADARALLGGRLRQVLDWAAERLAVGRSNDE